MKKETLDKILKGEKKTFRVDGRTYSIEIDEDDRSVKLIPFGSGSIADSHVQYNDYGYTHGGYVYRHAVEIAKEIAEALPEDTDE